MLEQFKDFKEGQDFIKMVESIMQLPDDLPEEAVTALTINVTNVIQSPDFIESMRGSFAGNTAEQAKQILDDNETIFINTLEELNPQGYKADILHLIFAGIIDCLKETYARKYEGKAEYTLYFELTNPNAKLPTYAHPEDACADIYCPETITVPAHAMGFQVNTGLKCVIPDGYEVLIRPRSGMSKKTPLRISNCVPTIDSNYLGEIGILFDNISSKPYLITAGDRIAQMCLKPVYKFSSVQVDDVNTLKQTDRADGGFGSSGK